MTSIQQKETIFLPALTELSPSEMCCRLSAGSSPNSYIETSPHGMVKLRPFG